MKRIAQSCIRDEELYYYFDIATFAKVTTHNSIGSSLLDFIWLDEGITSDTLEFLLIWYQECRTKKMTQGQTAEKLIESTHKLATHNPYLTAYIAFSIDFLLKDSIDDEYLNDMVQIYGADSNEELLNSYSVEDLKSMYISLLPKYIKLQQQTLEHDVDLVIGVDSPYKKYKPMQRLFLLSRSKEVETTYLNTRFTSSLDSPFDFRNMDDDATKRVFDEQNVELLALYDMADIDAMLNFELVQMILHQTIFRCCKYCGKFFVPKGRKDSEYCSRIMPGEDRPCNEIGASRVRSKKLAKDPVMRAYSQAYRRMDSRKRTGTITAREFNEWSFEASSLRDKCLNGEITQEEFQVWLDKGRKR